jgi:hypothetical protein
VFDLAQNVVETGFEFKVIVSKAKEVFRGSVGLNKKLRHCFNFKQSILRHFCGSFQVSLDQEMLRQMNQYKRMLLVDFDGMGEVSEILYEILVFFLYDGQSDVGINTSWVQF